MAEYEVTGVRWQMGEGLTMEQRTRMAEEFLRTLKVGTPMILSAEPDNPHDNEAIAVYIDYTRRVGYIKHECCAEVKGLLNGDGQCDAVVSGNDGHVTFYVEIPDAPEASVSPVGATRKLPDCPLPQGLGLAFSDEERALRVVAPRLANVAVSADTASTLLQMTERYMPLSRLSLCCEDDVWRDRVLKQLRKACRLTLPQPVKERLELLRDELHATVGDFHCAHEHWQERLFDRQLDVLRQKADGEDGLFAKYEKYRELQPDTIERLARWFNEMPHVELRNYREHAALARRLSYIGVSRRELYEVYAAILLLDRYGADVVGLYINKVGTATLLTQKDIELLNGLSSSPLGEVGRGLSFTCTPTATSPASASSCSSSASCPRSSTTSWPPTARTSATSTSNAKTTTPFLHKFSIPFPHKFH